MRWRHYTSNTKYMIATSSIYMYIRVYTYIYIPGTTAEAPAASGVCGAATAGTQRSFGAAAITSFSPTNMDLDNARVGGGVDGSGSRPLAIEGQCDICGGLGWNGAAETCVPLNVARCDDCCTVVQLLRPGFVAGGDELCL